MAQLKIGLRLESLRLPIRQAIRKSAQLGVNGVQFNAVGELSPSELGTTGRRDFMNVLRGTGLELSSLGFPSRRAFSDPDGLERRISSAQQVLSMAFEMGSPIVTGTIGRIPEDFEHPARIALVQAMTELGQHGDRSGGVFAIETGTESGTNLRGFIDSIATPSIRANYDPGNLLIKGYDPVQSALELNEVIVHAHAHDALRDRADELTDTVPPGRGDVSWHEVLGAFEEVGFHGWLVIEITNAVDPISEISGAVAFLRQFIH